MIFAPIPGSYLDRVGTVAAPRFTFHAYSCYVRDGMNPDECPVAGVQASAMFATVEEAKAFVATLPKSLLAKAGSLSGQDDANRDPATGFGRTWVSGYVTIYARLRPDAAVGAANEAGLRRWNTFRKLAARGGWSLTYVAEAGNSLSEAAARAIGGAS